MFHFFIWLNITLQFRAFQYFLQDTDVEVGKSPHVFANSVQQKLDESLPEYLAASGFREGDSFLTGYSTCLLFYPLYCCYKF